MLVYECYQPAAIVVSGLWLLIIVYLLGCLNYVALGIRPLFGDFMFFISLPRLFLLPAFFTIINNFLAKFKF